MSKYSTIRRYSLIIEKIGKKSYPSFEEIKDYMFNHGFELSERTIQRDLEQIRNDFGVDILYDRQCNGYYIEDYSGFSMNNFLRFLEIANTAELIIESLKEGKTPLTILILNPRATLRALNW